MALGVLTLMVISEAWSNDNSYDKMNIGTYMKKYIIILILILIGWCDAFAQGFVNTDFESANLSGYGAGSVPATNAIPGWTAYLGGTPLTNINYDVSPSSGGRGVYIYNSTNLQGNYYVYIEGTSSEHASIGQSATIPLTAQSLIWWGFGPDILSFNGQSLPFSNIGSGTHYDIFAANISAFAGQTGQLLFTSDAYPAAPGDFIDNIQFSSSPIPEPSALGLSVLGGLCFLWNRRKVKAV
jgi:hypothetical protein